MALYESVWNTFAAAGFLLILTFAIAAAYYTAKFTILVQRRYPEKAREYGVGLDSWGNSGLQIAGLFRKDDIRDPDMNKFRVRGRNCLVACLFFMMATPVGLMVIGVIGVLLRTP